VLNGGNSGPYGDDLAPAAKWLQLADEFHAASVDTSDGGVGIPIVWGTDAVHGHANIIGATVFPHNIGLGAARDSDLIERIGEATATEIRVTGQEWTFAPTVTVPQDYRWGRAYEGYSEDPKLVASFAGVFVKGLQGDPASPDFLKGKYVISSTKHFLADGGTDQGRDQGDAKIPEKDLIEIHNAGYVPAIENGVQTIMISFSSWQGKKLTGNKGLITESTAALTKVAFELYHVERLEIHCAVQNHASAAIPRKLGYTHEATRRGLGYANGKTSDAMIWTLLSDEYRNTLSPSAKIRVFDVVGNSLL
jgi:beta-glucosidase